MESNQLKDNLRKLISNGKEVEALNGLKTEFQHNENTTNALILLEYNFNKLEKEYMIDIISFYDYSTKKSKIIYGILTFIDKIGASSNELGANQGFKIIRVAKKIEQDITLYTISLVNRTDEFIVITHLGIIHEERPIMLSDPAYELKPIAGWCIELPEFVTGYIEYQPENPIFMERHSATSLDIRFIKNEHKGSKGINRAFYPKGKKIMLKFFTDQNFVAESEAIIL